MKHNETTSIKHFIAVHSNKGGVGKSSVTANLALAFAERGFRVALVDGDIHGPSMGLMFGNTQRPEAGKADEMVFPLEAHGIRFISMANLVDEQTPLIWRGAMVHSRLSMFINQVVWGERDIMIIDMPPGTGDALMTLAQALPLSGVVVVSTPQELSVLDTARGIQSLRQLEVPILGYVENMSWFTCDGCQNKAQVFGDSAGEIFCEEFDIPFLGSLPIDPEMVLSGDLGKPFMLDRKDSELGKSLMNIADRILMTCEAEQPSETFFVDWQELGFMERFPEPPKAEASGLTLQNVWQVSADEVGLEFQDGHRWITSIRALRLACPCAACIDEWTGQKILKESAVPQDISLQHIESVGRYGLRFFFSDGHNTGLYHFDRLREMAEQAKPQ